MQRALQFLLISTDPVVLEQTRAALSAEGHTVAHIPEPAEALDRLRNGTAPDLVLFDMGRMEASRPDTRRLASLRALLGVAESSRMVLLCEMGERRWQAAAQRLGVSRFLNKPLLRRDLEALVGECLTRDRDECLTREGEHGTMSHQPHADAQRAPVLTQGHPVLQMASPARSVDTAAPERPYHMEEVSNNRFFLAASPAMMEIYDQVLLLAPVDVPVLILGESGVGKEIIASLLHQHSARAAKRFVNVNCAALPSDLLESELFGHEAGAFTGATREKPGKFEMADKGTLLLDEIAEMSALMQAKLLHVLQDGQFSRLGSQHSTRVDVRVLAATNVEIDAAIAERRFREDLYYRLNTFTLNIPPLRERREEIPFLLEQMRQRTTAELKVPSQEFSRELVEAATEFHWPGNLRELRNFVTRTIVMRNQAAALRELRTRSGPSSSGPAANGAPGVSQAASQGASQAANQAASQRSSQAGSRDGGRDGSQGAKTFSTLAAEGAVQMTAESGGMRSVVRDMKGHAESRMIQEALTHSNWNRRHAAVKLNISYRALLYKIQQYRLTKTG